MIICVYFSFFRDIKDDNVALTSNGEVRLLDFGFLKDVSTPQRLRQQAISFASPEVIKCHKASYPSGWFSFGCLLAILIQKKAPFRTKSFNKTPSQLQCEPDLEKINDELAKDFIQKLLEKDPDERLQNIFHHPYLESASSKPIFIPGNLYHANMRDAQMKEAKKCFFEQQTSLLDEIFSAGYIVCPTEEHLKHFTG
uniref:Protein kinase domain-containing protein n=1 Tax=Panagrolaimus sp. ES5 TaxID=591445 RepID=A0AC34GBF1_9BILA